MAGSCSTNPFDQQTTNILSAKITECCAETNANLQTVANKIEAMTASQAAGLDTLAEKLDTVISKLQTIIDL